MFRTLSVCVLGLSALMVTGCGGSFSGVQAQAPAIQQDLGSTVKSSGEYTLFRGTGYLEGYDQHVEPLWTITLQEGQKIGFRWVVDENHKYNPDGAFHLVAFAGNEARDLGAFQKRDMRYAWAGSKSNIGGYFHGVQQGLLLEELGIK